MGMESTGLTPRPPLKGLGIHPRWGPLSSLYELISDGTQDTEVTQATEMNMALEISILSNTQMKDICRVPH